MQKVDLFQPFAADRVGAPPLTLRVAVTPDAGSIVGGVPQSTTRGEIYVLLSALPRELQERVRTAVQALIAGG